MAIKLGVDVPARLRIAPKDVFGNPALVDGDPVWTLSDPALGTITPDPGGMSALFVASGQALPVQVQVSADADLDANGVKTISDFVDLDLVAGQATSLGITVTPEPQP